MDPRFLLTVERAFPDARCYHALVDDERGQPCAWASLCTFPVDLATLAGPGAQSAVARIRTLQPGFARFRTLFVGLPVSLGQSHLAIAPDADASAVLAVLDDACAGVAERDGASLIVWKEFDPATATRLASLEERGYLRAETPAMHELDAGFASFEAYCAALTAHYRADIRRSERKFRASGLRVMQVDDAAEIARLYTAEVHRLYDAVVDRATVKLERLPLEFFHMLAHQFAGLIGLTVVADGDRIVAFNWGLLDGDVYRYLFCGMDYAVARDVDLYFNLMYHQLDAALRRIEGEPWESSSAPRRIKGEPWEGSPAPRRIEGEPWEGSPAPSRGRIEMGQTADVFKARLGCRAVPRSVYVRGTRPLTRAAVRWGSSLLFPRRPVAPTRAVFKAEPGEGRPGRYERASS